MIPLAASPRPTVSAAAPALGVELLERAVGRDWRHLRFEPALERAYEQETRPARIRRQLVCNLLGVLSFWLISQSILGPVADLPDFMRVLRWVVLSGSIAAILLIWRWRASPRAIPCDLITALGTLAITGYACLSFRFIAGTPALIHSAGLLLVFLHVGFGARLPFRYTLAVNLLVYLAYATYAGLSDADTSPVLLHHLRLFTVVLLFSTIGNHLLERRERESYLLERLRDHRRQALLRDAAELRELALRDGLTRVHNRRHFDAELERAWAEGQRSGRPLALLQVDIDHFKRYNDRYGHPQGDRCLVEVATAFDAVARRHGGLAARVGGEEFALLFPGKDDADAQAIAVETCDAVRALRLPHPTSTTARIVTVSIGVVAVTPPAGSWASSLVAAADAALYAAKGQGRDGFAGADPALGTLASPRQRKGVQGAATEHDASAAELAGIDRLSALLDRSRGRLCFPAELEARFQERHGAARRHQLAAGALGGMALMLLVTAFSGPIIPDIHDTVLRRLVGLTACGLAIVLLMLRVPIGWRAREGLVAALIAAYGLTLVGIQAQSRSPTVYSATLGLCLLPMFSSLVLAQTLRFSLVPALLICGAVATWMTPGSALDRESWQAALGVLAGATLYALLGGYLLEQARRRGYLLGQLRLAQAAVLERNTAHLMRLAMRDPLTRLPNRRHFEAELERLAAACAASGRPLSLLMVDLDHFKSYNDGYGHPAGDDCLRRVGTALLAWAQTEAVRPMPGYAPVAARIGGEEFGVLLAGCDASSALAAAQGVRQRIRDLRIEHAHSPAGGYVTASVGAASLVLGSAADARLLLKTADAALYRAKDQGRDRAAA